MPQFLTTLKHNRSKKAQFLSDIHIYIYIYLTSRSGQKARSERHYTDRDFSCQRTWNETGLEIVRGRRKGSYEGDEV